MSNCKINLPPDFKTNRANFNEISLLGDSNMCIYCGKQRTSYDCLYFNKSEEEEEAQNTYYCNTCLLKLQIAHTPYHLPIRQGLSPDDPEMIKALLYEPDKPCSSKPNPFDPTQQGICLEGAKCSDDSEDLELPKLPPISKQIKGVFKDSLSSFRKLVKGKRAVVSDEQASERMDICLDCPKLTNKGNRPRCIECGCYMDLKTHLVVAICPLDKWPKIKE